MVLKSTYNNNDEIIEIGVDEVGRGPMFGRVYCAAVILPKDNYKHELMKDSKKFTSKKKLHETADYIKANCLSYSIEYEEHDNIDKFNIKQATYTAMHKAIKNIITKDNSKTYNILLKSKSEIFILFFLVFSYINIIFSRLLILYNKSIIGE